MPTWSWPEGSGESWGWGMARARAATCISVSLLVDDGDDGDDGDVVLGGWLVFWLLALLGRKTYRRGWS